MSTISSNITASKEREKRKKKRSKKVGEEREGKKEKKRVALIENNGDNTQARTYQDANITRRVNLFIYSASYSVHNKFPVLLLTRILPPHQVVANFPCSSSP